MKNHVQVYRNINKTSPTGIHVYSVRGDDGLVKKHVEGIHLKDCKLRVGKKGRERVLAEKRKNVHAYIQGKEMDWWMGQWAASVEITYNPYKYDSFVVMETGEPIHEAHTVCIVENRIHAWLWRNGRNPRVFESYDEWK